MNQRNEIIRFGKYAGKTIGEIFFEDPKYLLWADENVNGFNLNDYFYYTCKKLSDEIDTNRILDVSFEDVNGY